MYIYVYMCVYACVRASVYACANACVMYVCLCLCVYACVCVRAYVYRCMCVCVCMCMYIGCKFVYVCNVCTICVGTYLFIYRRICVRLSAHANKHHCAMRSLVPPLAVSECGVLRIFATIFLAITELRPHHSHAQSPPQHARTQAHTYIFCTGLPKHMS